MLFLFPICPLLKTKSKAPMAINSKADVTSYYLNKENGADLIFHS